MEVYRFSFINILVGWLVDDEVYHGVLLFKLRRENNKKYKTEF